MTGLDPKELQQFLPAYLTDDQKRLLAQELRTFRQGMPYYTGLYPADTIQGDGWTRLQIYDFDAGLGRSVRGIILSNSCDIAPDNNRAIPAKLVFAPLVPLQAYAEKLLEAGIKMDAVAAKLESIRRQEVTSLFFLPAGYGLESEHIALLDDLHNVSVDKFAKDDKRKKLFTLSQSGVYLFILKLSIHFCRFHDRIVRY